MADKDKLNQSQLSKSHRKISRFLIYPEFQLRLILFNSLIVATAFAIMGLQCEKILAHARELGVMAGLPLTHGYFRFIDYQVHELITYGAVALVVTIAVCGLFSLVISHKIAGPIVRLRGYFKNIRDKAEPGQLTFRSGDYFDDLPMIVNEALRELKCAEKGKNSTR